MVAPSDMMDGHRPVSATGECGGAHPYPYPRLLRQVRVQLLWPVSGCRRIGGQPGQGNKYTYQMDPANTDEALREVALDLEEGPTWSW